MEIINGETYVYGEIGQFIVEYLNSVFLCILFYANVARFHYNV